jgi:hypothetical protein
MGVSLALLGDRWFDLVRKRILDKAIAANGLPNALVNLITWRLRQEDFRMKSNGRR